MLMRFTLVIIISYSSFLFTLQLTKNIPSNLKWALLFVHLSYLDFAAQKNVGIHEVLAVTKNKRRSIRILEVMRINVSAFLDSLISFFFFCLTRKSSTLSQCYKICTTNDKLLFISHLGFEFMRSSNEDS